MKFLILLVCVLYQLSECSVSTHRNLRVVYREWKKKFGKEHSDLRSNIDRFRQFQKSAKTIDLINSMQDEWRADFTLFADMTEGEKRMYLGQNSSLEDTATPKSLKSDVLSSPSDPATVYWNMGRVQNQGSCGSCWAFAAVAAIEGRHIKEHGEYRELSEQTLLDCAKADKGRGDGCDGWYCDYAVSWTNYNPNAKRDYSYLPLREDNPYLGYDRAGCPDDKNPYRNALNHAKIKGRSARGPRTDAGLQHNVATEGPTMVSIYSSWALGFYTTGTYSGTGCGTDPETNHAVVVAGYEKGWWYVKNSWGSSWGYSGYAYFSRYWENLCSISRFYRSIEWKVNPYYDICKHTPERERASCVDDGDLSESECEDRGCCFDPSASSKRKQCFAKGKLTIHDGKGSRRVIYGSVGRFSELNFQMATSVEAEMGTWILYGGHDWYSGPTRVITPKDGRVRMNVNSVRLIASKNTIHLFQHYEFSGNKLSLSKKTDKLDFAFNNKVSSFISYGGPWTLCDGENQQGTCHKVDGSEKKMSSLNDRVSSVH